MGRSEGRGFQAEGTAHVKVLRQKSCRVFKGSMRGPVWLEGGSKGKRRRR